MYSISQFERALSICPLDHPCRGVAQSNLAAAKFIYCQVNDTAASLDIPLRLYHNALAARPVGHADRPSTLIQLAMVHFARFEKRGDDLQVTRAEALIHEAMELSSTETHESQVAAFVLWLHTGRRAGAFRADDPSFMGQDLAPRLTDKDLRILSGQLLDRVERFVI